MSLVIDAKMILFADRMNISSSRMVNEYGLSTIDEIIEAETAKGNKTAVKRASDYASSPEQLIELFRLADVENRFVLISKMNEQTRLKVLPLLEQEDLVMGMNFFTKEGLLDMLLKVDRKEIVRVALEAFSQEGICTLLTEDDLAGFFTNIELDRNLVMEQLELLPKDMMQKFIESVTGKPSEQTQPQEIFTMMEALPDDEYRKFMASIDPTVQRQLVFQITKTEPEYLALFDNMTYANMLNSLMKPDLVKSMVMLEKTSLMKMVATLPKDLIAVVGAQVDTKDFAVFVQKYALDLLESAWMI